MTDMERSHSADAAPKRARYPDELERRPLAPGEEPWKLYHIIEWDNDYRTPTGFEVKEFPSWETAEAWCKHESWTGYSYTIDRSHFMPGVEK